jgi:hypothetical protein
MPKLHMMWYELLLPASVTRIPVLGRGSFISLVGPAFLSITRIMPAWLYWAHLTRTLVRNGAADCILVMGFEQMRPGSIKSVLDDRPSPVGPSIELMEETYGKHPRPRNAQYFGNAGREYMQRCFLTKSSNKKQYTSTNRRPDMAEKWKTSQKSPVFPLDAPREIRMLNSTQCILCRRFWTLLLSTFR